MATTPVTPVVVKSGFWTRFKADWKKFWGEAPQWVAFAQKSVALAVPVITDIETFDPALTPVIAPVLAGVKVDLALTSTLVNDMDSSTSLTTTLTNLQAALPTILTLDGVKNSSSAAAITAKVNQAVAIIASVQAAVQETKATSAESTTLPAAA